MVLVVETGPIQAAPYRNLISFHQKTHPYTVRPSPSDAEPEKLAILCGELGREGSADSSVSQLGVIAGQETRTYVSANRRLALLVALTVVGDGIALEMPVVETVLEVVEKPIADPEYEVVRH